MAVPALASDPGPTICPANVPATAWVTVRAVGPARSMTAPLDPLAGAAIDPLSDPTAWAGLSSSSVTVEPAVPVPTLAVLLTVRAPVPIDDPAATRRVPASTSVVPVACWPR